MGSLWTPDGERPVPPAEAAGAPDGRDGPDSSGDAPLTEEEVRQQMAALQQELANTPAATVIANHAYGMFELAALHLSLQPPQLAEAQVAIDALAGVIDGVGDRFGEHAANLREGLAQLRLAFVQIRAANLGTAEPPPPS